MSASIFARTAVQFLTAVSPTDLISCFTFSVAFAAAARACSLRASILSCASFSAAATASSVFLARTDKSASCWESGLAIYFLHLEPTGHEHGWHLPASVNHANNDVFLRGGSFSEPQNAHL